MVFCMNEHENDEIKQKEAENEPVEEPSKEPEKTSESKSFFLREIPFYLVVLFMVAAVLLGIAFSMILFPKEPPIVTPPVNGGTNPPATDLNVDVTLLVDETCTVCQRHNTIIDSLRENGFEVNVQEISVNSPEGIRALARYRPNILPTALVDILDIAKLADIKQAMDDSGFPRIDGKYVVPELNLDSTKIYPREFLSPPLPGDCDVNSSKVRVNLFDNPFHEVSIKSTPELNESLGKFSDEEIDVLFEYLPTTVSTLDSDQNAELFNKNIGYLTCSSTEGKVKQMHDWILGYYCDVGGNPQNLTSEEIGFCNASTHFGKLLTFDELENARLSLGLPANVIDACVNLQEVATRTSLERARDYSLRIPTTAVVQCKYNVPYQAIDDAICLVNPGLSGCT